MTEFMNGAMFVLICQVTAIFIGLNAALVISYLRRKR